MKIGPVSLLGVGTGYRATLMSGGSHRLWNQLLHATLFRSASLFPWRTRRLAFQSRVEFSPLFPSSKILWATKISLSLSFSPSLSLSAFCLGRKKKKTYYTGRNCSYYTGRKGVTEDRFHERSDQSRLRSTRVYKNAAIIVI